MATDGAELLALAGVILVVAFAASALFRRTRVPDILFLLGLGAVLGPATGAIDAGFIAAALPLIAAMAVVLILFDGALEITPTNMRQVGTASLVLSLSIFTATTAVCGIIVHYALGFTWPLAFLLGMAFSGAGIAIIVPMAQSMGISKAGLAVIIVEAVVSDIMVVMGVSLMATALVLGGVGGILGPLAMTILVAVIVGLVGGWIWNRILDRLETSPSAYMISLAALFLVYAATEVLGGAGALAVLLFGVMAGHGHRAQVARRSDGNHGRLVAFHHEIAFFVRAFFFVFLGAAMDWRLLADPVFLITGALLALAIAATRMLSVAIVLRRQGLASWDRIVAGVLFPMGLVTAAVSVIPHSQFGIPGTESFGGVATVVILLTNILATLFVFGASWRNARLA